MKCRMLLIISLMFVITMLSACSLPFSKPNEGIWYCEELRLEIDFNQVSGDGYPTKKYNPDGSYINAVCLIAYGDWLVVETLETHECCMAGDFKYRNGIFSVTTFENRWGDDDMTYTIETYATNHTYTFKRIDVTQT